MFFQALTQPLFGSSIPFRRKWWLSMSKSVRYLWQATRQLQPTWVGQHEVPSRKCSSFPYFQNLSILCSTWTNRGGSFQRKIQYMWQRQQPEHGARVDITGRPFEPLILWALDWCFVLPWLGFSAYRISNVLEQMHWVLDVLIVDLHRGFEKLCIALMYWVPWALTESGWIRVLGLVLDVQGHTCALDVVFYLLTSWNDF